MITVLPQRAAIIHPMNYRRDIDGLRAVAVIPVVLGHAGMPGFSGGYVGVDIFFVISGFLITSILSEEIAAGRFSIIGFYERRARRILPSLLSVISVCMLLGYLVLTPQAYLRLSNSAMSALMFASNFWFAQSAGDYFGTAAELEPLLHSWSLAVEEQFYIVFPLLLWLFGRVRGRLVGILTLLVLASIASSILMAATSPAFGFFFSPGRFWELGLGALLALGLPPPARHPIPAQLVAGLGMAVILACILLYDAEIATVGIAALAPCLGAVAIIWAGSATSRGVTALLSTPAFVAIGLISYSLYLWHWPVLVFLREANYGSALDLPLSVLAVLSSLVLAVLSWRLVEAPFRRPARRGGYGRRSVFLATGLWGGGLGFAAFAVIMSGGIPARVPASLLARYDEASARTPRASECEWQREDSSFCRIGDLSGPANRPSALFWGDSHAEASRPGVSDWLAGQGLLGLAAIKHACPPLLGVVRLDQGPGHRCDAFNTGVLGYLKRHPEIDLVILHARWALAAEGVRAEGEFGDAALLGTTVQQDDPSRSRDQRIIFANGLERTLAALSHMQRRVIVMESVPELGYSATEALLGSQFLRLADQAPPDRTEIAARNAFVTRTLDRLQRQFGFQRAAIAPLLCQPACLTEISGHLLYRDDDHLSMFGARHFIPRALIAAR